MYLDPKPSCSVRRLARALLGIGLLLFAGCSSSPVHPNTPPPSQAEGITGEQLVAVAETLIGAPYRYGGTSPNGFDCSGLVQYAYKEAGLDVPRSTQEQLRYAQSVNLGNLRAGDVLFFRVSRHKISHVGIYTGNGRFIHAPSTGRHVSYARLDNPFWKKRLVRAGRLH